MGALGSLEPCASAERLSHTRIGRFPKVAILRQPQATACETALWPHVNKLHTSALRNLEIGIHSRGLTPLERRCTPCAREPKLTPLQVRPTMLLYSFLERSTMHERVFAGALRDPAVIRRLEVLRRGAVPCSDRAS